MANLDAISRRFDPSIAQSKRQATRKRGSILSNSELGTSRTNQDFRTLLNTLKTGLTRDVESNEDRFAAQGLFDSGIRKGVESEIGEDFVSQAGQATTSYQRALEDIARGRTQGLSGVNTELESGLFGGTRNSIESLLQSVLNKSRGQVSPTGRIS